MSGGTAHQLQPLASLIACRRNERGPRGICLLLLSVVVLSRQLQDGLGVWWWLKSNK